MRTDDKRVVNVFYGQVMAALFMSFLGMWGITQYVASALAYQPQLGPPVWVVFDYPIYEPWSWFFWAYYYDSYATWVFDRAWHLTITTYVVLIALVMVMAVRRTARRVKPDTYGSSQWATEKDLKKAAMLEDSGVVLAQTNDAKLHEEVSINEKGDVKPILVMDKPGKKLIRHDDDVHILVFAGSRSGKGVGLVVPTLLSWVRSVVVYDLKRELWQITAGWRQKFSRVLRFDPTEPFSVRFNPLQEIRKGLHEVKDVQNITEMLIDPDATKEQKDHWEKNGNTLLQGIILHVLYAEKNKSIPGLLEFMSDPKRPMYECLEAMLNTRHLGDRPHPVVASVAREMLNKHHEELASVWSTAVTCLGLYRDPIIAHNTSESDFTIDEIVNDETPVSLYIVVPPSDDKRTRPLIRVMLNQIGRRLMEKSAGTDGSAAHRHRLLMLLDEFAGLGQLGFLEESLGYSAGYGIKYFLITQDLSQINKYYTENNTIIPGCHVRVSFGVIDDKTAKRVESLLGQGTVTRNMFNFAGSRLAPWLGHVMESAQETARPLLYAGEIMQLPMEYALVIPNGRRPYMAKKVVYYSDPRFEGRADLLPPNAEEEQCLELSPPEGRNPWRYTGPLPVDPSQSSQPKVKKDKKQKAAPVAEDPPIPEEAGSGTSQGVPENDYEHYQSMMQKQELEEREEVEVKRTNELQQQADDDQAQTIVQQEQRKQVTQRNRTVELSRNPRGGGLPL